MKNHFKKIIGLLFALLLLLIAPIAKAQLYPVEVSVSTTPPYYNFLSHYGDQNNHLLIIATLTANPPLAPTASKNRPNTNKSNESNGDEIILKIEPTVAMEMPIKIARFLPHRLAIGPYSNCPSA